jgi:hypothetical protein
METIRIISPNLLETILAAFAGLATATKSLISSKQPERIPAAMLKIR